MKRELNTFLASVMFFTRIPLPSLVRVSSDSFTDAAKYFPVIGWIVGGLASLIIYLTAFVFPPHVTVMIAILSTILITGAFHEDGLADVCDGFGAGWTKEKILSIMKDSHIGVYGVTGVVCSIVLRYVTMSEIDFSKLPSIILVGQSLSRFAAVTFMVTHTYVRESGESKSKDLSGKKGWKFLMLAALFGMVPLLLLKNLWYVIVLLPVFLIIVLLGRYYNKWIGGYTGDCLGAAQQVTEIVIYLFFLIPPWKYT